MKENIVIISGAGISTNAGVDNFCSFSGTGLSSQSLFHSSAYCILERAAQLHSQLLTIFTSASTSGPTSLDSLMEAWAQRGRIRRHYTQNIDCRSDRLPSLSQRTIMLHGRVDTLRCSIRPQHTFRVTAESFSHLINDRCPLCEDEQKQRELEGNRRRSTGSLRSNVLLYGECNPEEPEIVAAFNDDLHRPVDAVIIAGTRLAIDDLRNFVGKLYEKAKSDNRKCLIVWVNRESPKIKNDFEIDHVFLGDCDEFTLAMAA
ncbi:DHS-like NAD/FAD-binding domain-containing protein [Lindgomyces ingoldianus]|uniref:DHS-like NAD/FAD-binding domain-containing protein n=1 Tax=Lindgomyces ingoldianus TaxID=673940 RepID=A0ACB6QA87_9PLEO|nr:DHS-like NAD/FAD-binding domain-containing protein [Lindgomyces ingoldianus]KAF2463817.1 DHS-like NAD/FAD-binding domain-containing protein [Lindgomyces ingoldianus]